MEREPVAGTEKRFEFCYKKHRPCSKPKGHTGRCDSNRALSEHQKFWLKAPNNIQHQLQHVERIQHQQPDAERIQPAVERQRLSQRSTECPGNLTVATPSNTATATDGDDATISQPKRRRVEVDEVSEKRLEIQRLEAEVERLKQKAVVWHQESVQLETYFTPTRWWYKDHRAGNARCM
ncbi:uncharacterized protein [Branchiostoma lanceolatum]|uniref:uncharacterized protein n=1 Tax=Branchiostoma lanceolatum TaxID=7740 RepID=UPI0034549227